MSAGRGSLAEASRHRLLDRDEEIALARRIQAGQAAEMDLADLAYTRAPVADLRALVEDGAAAKETLIKHNLRLAWGVAKKFSTYTKTLSYWELFSEACIGLMRAADLFDPDKGVRFSTYGTLWCQQACRKAVASFTQGMRLPVNLDAEIRHMALALEAEGGASLDDVASRLGLSREDFDEKRLYMERSRFVYDTEDTGIAAAVVDEDADTEAAGVGREMASMMGRLLASVPDLDRRIVELRWGLADGQPRSADEVAEMLGITGERARAGETRAMSYIRHPSSGIMSIPELGIPGLIGPDDV